MIEKCSCSYTMFTAQCECEGGKWVDRKKRANPTAEKNTEEDEWYCFRVIPEMDTNLFKTALDRLINEAKQNGDLQAIAE